MSKGAKKKCVKYHNDGAVWAKRTTVSGVPQGYWEWFRKDGSKMRGGYFTDGKPSSKWTTYDRKRKGFKVTEFGIAKDRDI
jgi:hypothetical protein